MIVTLLHEVVLPASEAQSRALNILWGYPDGTAPLHIAEPSDHRDAIHRLHQILHQAVEIDVEVGKDGSRSVVGIRPLSVEPNTTARAIEPGHLLLGELITELEKVNPDLRVVRGFGPASSYRGYYDHVAFAPAPNTLVGDMLRDARFALGNIFSGWKGGEFNMTAYTPVWLANRGCVGERLTDVLLEQMLSQKEGLWVMD